jgi:glycosyltransferase-like protein
MSRPLNIAMLAHSTNPRGGVAHAMNLSEALVAQGLPTTLHAPDVSGRGFFRAPQCETAPFAVAPAPSETFAMVEQRIGDYVNWFRRPEHRRFDLYHAHDGISGNALATLKAQGLIPGYCRTVHHIDDFADARLARLQERSIVSADALMVVSEAWRRRLREDYGLAAEVGGNGVDPVRFSPRRDSSDATLARRLGLGDGPVLLSVGGVEARKNTIRILQAFEHVARVAPTARLVIAGGASLLDHKDYAVAFRMALSSLGAHAANVLITGPVDDAEMPALYRLASVLVFASVKEGFGLCVLEALASGTPVVVSRIAPFVDYLGPRDVLWCDPGDPRSIAAATLSALEADFRTRGPALAARFSWATVAQRHLPTYAALAECVNA